MINCIYNKFTLGAEKPFRLMHITDIHLACPDETDEERIIRLAEKRKKKYPFSESFLSETEILSKKENALPIITGDMTDCYSHGSAAAVKKFTDKNDCLFAVGNHDFRVFGGMEYDVPSSREKNLDAVNSLYRNDVRFFSREINGVNIVGIDDAYYRFEAFQLEKLKKEIEKGLPIILALHVPLYTPSCYDLMVNEKRKYASLICVPEDKMQLYPSERYEQQKEDKITREMYEFILSQSLIKLLVCGHVHKNFEAVLPNGIPQIITGTETARIIEIS